MKKLGDIMAEMGFRKEASDSVKEAFVKHLIKSATGVTVETPSEKKWKAQKNQKSKAQKKEAPQPVQLSFDFDRDESQKKEKAS